MKEIPLTQGKVALVDDEDFELVNQYRWYALRNHRTFYAVKQMRQVDGRRGLLWMHRLILGLTDSRQQADHINHNGLDNRRVNLRVVSQSENAQNRRMALANKSGFKGVALDSRTQRYRVQIRINRKPTTIGYFATAEEAARVYDAKARELYGEFACVNFT